MKKIKVFLALAGILLVPSLGYTAYNDVSLDSNVVLSINGMDLDIVGSTDTNSTIAVHDTYFTVTLASGSVISVRSSNKYTLANDAASAYVTESVCTESESRLRLAYTGDSTVNITVTPSSSTCSISGSSSGSGGGGIVSSGGGGGGGSSSATAPTITPTVVANSQTVVPSVSVSLFVPFTVSLDVGMTSPDVLRLQKLLNSDPATVIASSGVGSPGNETDYFGSLTAKAVGKFQIKYGVVMSANDPGYGYVGAKTRAKLNEVFGGAISQPSPAPEVLGASISSAEQARMLQDQLDALMLQLKALQSQR